MVRRRFVALECPEDVLGESCPFEGVHASRPCWYSISVNSMQRFLCLLVTLAVHGSAADVADQIRSHKSGTAVWWTGNAGWLIRSGDLVISVDLDLSTAGKLQPPPLTAGVAAKLVDVALVSHHHGDHCNVPTIRALAEGGRTTLVLPATCVKRISGLELTGGASHRAAPRKVI